MNPLICIGRILLLLVGSNWFVFLVLVTICDGNAVKDIDTSIAIDIRRRCAYFTKIPPSKSGTTCDVLVIPLATPVTGSGSWIFCAFPLRL